MSNNPNSFSIRGKIAEILEPQTFGKLTKRDFALQFSDGRKDQTVRFELIGDKMNQIDDLEVDDEVTVHFDVRGHRNEKTGSIYNNLTVWRIETDADPEPRKPQRHQKQAQYRQRKSNETWSPGGAPVNGDGEIDF